MDDRRRQARLPVAVAPRHDAHEHGDGRAMPSAAELQPAASPDIGLRLDLVAALKQLPVEQREPLLLVTLEQLSYAECAELLRIPIGTVMSRISRGRTALRALLAGHAPNAAAHGLRRVV
jgi:RNA polymerase sigma-70 factor (ECF subfamily)